MDEYTGNPKISVDPEDKFFRVSFHKGTRADDIKTRIVGHKFETETEANLWANQIIAMGRTKSANFESMSWEEQTPILQGIIKTISKVDLEENWKNRV